MLLGILADTHDQLARTHAAVELLRKEGATALIHCGDLFSPPIVAALSVLPSWFVLGNHDSDSVPHLEAAADEFGVHFLGSGGIVELDDKRLGVAHGHLTADIERVLSEKPDYLLWGHSHVPSDEIIGSIRRINPGALHRADEFTVALLDLSNGQARFLSLPRYPWFAEQRAPVDPPVDR